jgi:hypothetical protein
LKALSLGQYAEVFEANDISGSVLLDLSLEDLDYLDIKALGHRKLILKGIEDLRKNKRMTIDVKAGNANNPKPISDGKALFSQSMKSETSIADKLESLSKSMTVESLSQQVADTKKATHWSDIEPLSRNEVSNPNPVTSNAADGNDLYDEEAEQKAFQEAVMEWRRANNAAKDAAPASAELSQTMWDNPFAAPQSKTIIERENNTLTSATSHSEVSHPESASLAADGVLDEEAERRVRLIASYRCRHC